MEILFGLLIATVLAFGWIVGNLFVCVFLTLGTLFIGLLLGASMAGWCIPALALIWAPRLIITLMVGWPKQRRASL